MSNPNYDDFEIEDLIIGARLNAANRAILNFVMSGLGLTDAGGLLLEVAAGFLYANGYEVENPAPDFVGLTDNATNYVFFGFVRTPDAAPPSSVLSIAPDLVVKLVDVSPGADYIRVGEVDTVGGNITDIREDDNRRDIGAAQLSENVEANHQQFERMVAHKGTLLPPAAPPTEAGQLFYRTTDLKYFIYNGVTWIELAAAAAPAPPGLIAVVNGTAFLILKGTPLKAVPGMPGSVEPASQASLATSQVIGIADADIPPFAPGFAASVQGVLVEAKFSPGLVLTNGETSFLGVEELTNIQTAVIGEAIKPVAICWDATLYDGIGALLAVVLFQLEHATVVS